MSTCHHPKKCVNPRIFSLVSEFFSNLFPWIFLKVLQLEGMLRETSLISDLQIPSLRDLTSGIHWVFPNGVTRSGWLKLSATRHRRKKTPYILTMKAKFLGHFVELDQSESSNENWAGLFLFHGYKKRTNFSVQEKNGQNTTSQLTMCFLGWKNVRMKKWAMPSHRSAAMASFLDVGQPVFLKILLGRVWLGINTINTIYPLVN